MKGLRVGELNTPVTFQERAKTGTTEFNTSKKTDWQDIPAFPSVKCKVKTMATGTEQVEHGRLANTQALTIWIRYRTDLNVKMSFVIDGVRYYINDVSNPPDYRKVLTRIDGRKSE